MIETVKASTGKFINRQRNINLLLLEIQYKEVKTKKNSVTVTFIGCLLHN